MKNLKKNLPNIILLSYSLLILTFFFPAWKIWESFANFTFLAPILWIAGYFLFSAIKYYLVARLFLILLIPWTIWYLELVSSAYEQGQWMYYLVLIIMLFGTIGAFIKPINYNNLFKIRGGER